MCSVNFRWRLSAGRAEAEISAKFMASKCVYTSFSSNRRAFPLETRTFAA
jgi:hypothetical protein